MEVCFTLLGWFLSVITATGNGFVIFIIMRARLLHLASNRFVVSLAVADFCVGIFVFPLGFLCNNVFSCDSRVWMSLHWFFLHSSVTNLCTLTWDRYSAVLYPLVYNSSISAKRPSVVILLAWLVSFLVSLTLLLGVYTTTSETALIVLRILGVPGFDLVCSFWLVYAVIRILAVARSHSRQEDTFKRQVHCKDVTTATVAQISKRRRKNRTASFITVIEMFFLGCYGFVMYLVLCLPFLSCGGVSLENASKVATVLVVFNSAVNPSVYAFLKKDIKKELVRILCPGRSRNQSHVGSITSV